MPQEAVRNQPSTPLGTGGVNWSPEGGGGGGATNSNGTGVGRQHFAEGDNHFAAPPSVLSEREREAAGGRHSRETVQGTVSFRMSSEDANQAAHQVQLSRPSQPKEAHGQPRTRPSSSQAQPGRTSLTNPTACFRAKHASNPNVRSSSQRRTLSSGANAPGPGVEVGL